jgi:hypothetical protein
LRFPIINLVGREQLEATVDDLEAAYLFDHALSSFRQRICNLGGLQLLEGLDFIKARISLAILVAPTRVHWGALAIRTLTRTVLKIMALRRVGGMASGDLRYQLVPFAYIHRLFSSHEKSFHPVIKI